MTQINAELQVLPGSITPDLLAPGGTTPDATKFYRGDGTWQIPGGGGGATPLRVYPINRPTLSDFTATNLGGSDAYGTYSDGSIWLQCAAFSDGLHARMLLKPYSIPASGHTYTLVAALQPSMYNRNYFEQGIVLYDSVSGKLHWFGLRGSYDNIQATFGFAWEQWDSVTNSGSGGELTHRKTVYLSEALWLKFTDDGTTQTIYASPDGCDNSWIILGSSGSTSWNTADHIGLFNMPYEGTPGDFNTGASATLVVPSWLETTT